MSKIPGVPSQSPLSRIKGLRHTQALIAWERALFARRQKRDEALREHQRRQAQCAEDKRDVVLILQEEKE